MNYCYNSINIDVKVKIHSINSQYKTFKNIKAAKY